MGIILIAFIFYNCSTLSIIRLSQSMIRVEVALASPSSRFVEYRERKNTEMRKSQSRYIFQQMVVDEFPLQATLYGYRQLWNALRSAKEEDGSRKSVETLTISRMQFSRQTSETKEIASQRQGRHP